MTRIWVRRGMAVVVACLLLVTVGSELGYPQPKPEPPRIDVAPAKRVPDLDLPDIPAPARVAPPTVDQLIATLEDLKRQREAIDKQEKAVAEQLRERLKDQQERLAKLGLNAAKPAVPPKIDAPDIEVPPPPPVAPK